MYRQHFQHVIFKHSLFVQIEIFLGENNEKDQALGRSSKKQRIRHLCNSQRDHTVKNLILCEHQSSFKHLRLPCDGFFWKLYL